MRDKLYIKTRLDNVCLERIPQDPELQRKHQERIRVLTWIFNLGELRTEQELQTELRNANEEIICYEKLQFNNKLLGQLAEIRKSEIENILEI